MTQSLKESSWIERTIKLCDRVLMRAAKADPANTALRGVAPRGQTPHLPERTPGTGSSPANLASQP